MIQLLEDGNFILEIFLFILQHVVSPDDFDSSGDLRLSIDTLSHFTKGALAKLPTNLVEFSELTFLFEADKV